MGYRINANGEIVEDGGAIAGTANASSALMQKIHIQNIWELRGCLV